ncbi:peptidase S8/S53 domain-containing protein [Scenedesmus sp. NREL 46B-D3]|nr:peptidase S8/S53 domain-containing protein [Scenedesmus sp. NREL 46B-D3]
MPVQLTSAAAEQLGFRVVLSSPVQTVFEGTVLTVAAAGGDVQRLRHRLQQDPAVDTVWIARHASHRCLVAAAGGDGQRLKQRLQRDPAVDTVWVAHPGLDGSGSLICLVDTGVQYTLPLFGSCTGINAPAGQCSVVVGRDMVGDGYDGAPGSLPVEGDAPLDCYDHGTRVASVAATANGVAPGAKLGIYRIFGCDGVATDAVIVPALDRAVRDGCHIINLSIADISGYEERPTFWLTELSPYRDVMRAAFEQGVLSVKSAGNSGTAGAFFEADVSVAAGSITVGSVGAFYVDVDEAVEVSEFSSFGPHHALELTPHICAPGATLAAYSRAGRVDRVSGTSFSCPYVSGILALWRQGKQRQAQTARRALRPSDLSQAAALGALVSTAAMVKTLTPYVVEPVARCGAGVVQADALLANQISIEPTMLQPPSNLRRHWVAAVRLTWTGAAPVPVTMTYEVTHVPAYSLDITGSGSRTAAGSATMQPPPASDPTGSFAPLVIPYQGYSQVYRRLPIMARPIADRGDPAKEYYASLLEAQARALCYAPGSEPSAAGSRVDDGAAIPGACAGGFAARQADWVDVSLAALRGSPECSLRVTLAPQVPMQWLDVDVHARNGSRLGSLPPLDTSANGCLVSSGRVWSWCLGFNGSYTSLNVRDAALRVGSQYRLVAYAVGPVAARDALNKVQPRREKVNIKGIINVVA